jgi:hypothetical protein
MSPHPSYRTNAFIGGGARYGDDKNGCGTCHRVAKIAPKIP